MTFWGLEGKHIPFIIKSKIFQYQEGLFSLSWILSAHTSSFPHPTSPFMTLNKDENWTKGSLVLIACSLISNFLKIAASWLFHINITQNVQQVHIWIPS